MKNKHIVIIIVILGILIVGIFAYIFFQKKNETDWSYTFYNTDTNPYGTYITYNLLKDIFNDSIESTVQPIYINVKPYVEKYINYNDETEDEERNELIYNSVKEISDTTTYIFINDSFDINNIDLPFFLDFIALGNNTFISAERLSPLLLDTLKVNAEYINYGADSTYILIDYDNRKYTFESIISYTKLDIDNCIFPTRVLAKNNLGNTVFLQIKYGKGNIFLHTIPAAFTNIHMLKKNKYDFGFRSLSYIPTYNKILWDEYQKQGLNMRQSDEAEQNGEYKKQNNKAKQNNKTKQNNKAKQIDEAKQSIFRVLLKNRSLQLALLISIIGLLLYAIFGAKRIQRIIPIIKPPLNSSVEFLNTISNLYYKKKDYKSIIHYRHLYFLDYIRKNYYMSTENINEELINNLHAKSGMDKDKIKKIFKLYDNITLNQNPNISNDIFLGYNNLLDEFYRNIKNK